MPDRMRQSVSVRTNVYGGSPLVTGKLHRQAHHYLHRLVFTREADELSYIGGYGIVGRAHITGHRDQGGGKDPVGVTYSDPDPDLTHIDA